MLSARLNSVRSYIGLHGEARKLGIGSSDLVVDIGSGQSPHPRANVLVDRFGFDNSERACHAPISVDRPLVVADAAQTPFPDRTFDFAFCSTCLSISPTLLPSWRRSSESPSGDISRRPHRRTRSFGAGRSIAGMCPLRQTRSSSSRSLNRYLTPSCISGSPRK